MPSTSTPTTPGQKEAVLQEALAEIAQEQAAKEAEVWKKLDQIFGELPESGQPTPPCAQAPAVVLQETPAGLEEEREGEDDEVTLPREARGTTLINLDLAKQHVTTPDHHEGTSPVLVITLPPVQEQVVAEEVPMAAPLVHEQVAPEEVEMVEEGVPEKDTIPDEAMFLYGVSEETLTAGDRARLEKQ